MKAGIKTTEFWLTKITTIVGILLMTGQITPDQLSAFSETANVLIGGIMATVPTASYTISRGMAKKTPPTPE